MEPEGPGEGGQVEPVGQGRQVPGLQLVPEASQEERVEEVEHKVLEEGGGVFVWCSSASVGKPLEGEEESAEQLKEER